MKKLKLKNKLVMKLSAEEKSAVKGGQKIVKTIMGSYACWDPPANTQWDECPSMMNTAISCCAP